MASPTLGKFMANPLYILEPKEDFKNNLNKTNAETTIKIEARICSCKKSLILITI